MNYEWITPVTDRTYDDVLQAGYYLSRKKNGLETGFVNQKGCLNYEDLNRIENNMACLAEILETEITVFTEWSLWSVPLVSDRKRLLENISEIVKTFAEKYPARFSATELPKIPTALQTYTNINALEEIQLLIYEILLPSALITKSGENLTLKNGSILMTKGAIENGI